MLLLCIPTQRCPCRLGIYRRGLTHRDHLPPDGMTRDTNPALPCLQAIPKSHGLVPLKQQCGIDVSCKEPAATRGEGKKAMRPCYLLPETPAPESYLPCRDDTDENTRQQGHRELRLVVQAASRRQLHLRSWGVPVLSRHHGGTCRGHVGNRRDECKSVCRHSHLRDRRGSITRPQGQKKRDPRTPPGVAYRTRKSTADDIRPPPLPSRPRET